MKKLNMLYKLLFVALMLTLGGCAGIVEAPSHLDAKAKEFKSNPNYSQVYLYRNENLGGAFAMPISVDGKLAGTTGVDSYFKFNLSKGEHIFDSQEGGSRLKLNTELGKLYFIWQEVKMGLFSPNSKLQLVSEAEGKKAVMESKLIDSKIGQ